MNKIIIERKHITYTMLSSPLKRFEKNKLKVSFSTPTYAPLWRIQVRPVHSTPIAGDNIIVFDGCSIQTDESNVKHAKK
jgi:c-di-GMP-binding flagellar brake protein YcgR